MLLTAAAPQSLVEVRPRGLPCRQQTGGDSRDQRQQRAYRDQRQLDAKRFRVDKTGVFKIEAPPRRRKNQAQRAQRPARQKQSGNASRQGKQHGLHQ